MMTSPLFCVERKALNGCRGKKDFKQAWVHQLHAKKDLHCRAALDWPTLELNGSGRLSGEGAKTVIPQSLCEFSTRLVPNQIPRNRQARRKAHPQASTKKRALRFEVLSTGKPWVAAIKRRFSDGAVCAAKGFAKRLSSFGRGSSICHQMHDTLKSCAHRFGLPDENASTDERSLNYTGEFKDASLRDRVDIISELSGAWAFSSGRQAMTHRDFKGVVHLGANGMEPLRNEDSLFAKTFLQRRLAI